MDKGLKLFNRSKNSEKITNNVKTTPVLKKEKVVAVKTLTRDEERDLKAKEVVEKLLQDVIITPKSRPDELLIVDDEPQSGEGLGWLEEQIELLTQKNNLLTSELVQSKEDYIKLYNNGGIDVSNDIVRQKVIELFNEIQSNHITLGSDPTTGVGNFRIYCPGFLNRLIMFFPFLSEFKQY